MSREYLGRRRQNNDIYILFCFFFLWVHGAKERGTHTLALKNDIYVL